MFSKKSIISDKHHRITYMYINFLAKLGYYRAVKSMHTTLFAKKS